ncbi:MAG: putative methanogenesis regulatory protein FilR2 [Candidatus Methanogaster sp.]|nr:MAG: putative methanogenesis regulatory protein FilR2 [ANME-2 cluster archaeon]
MKVMVVDDEPDIVDLLLLMLDGTGYEVITASGGNDCLEKLKHDVPDLILLDLIMPDLDGWEVLNRIRGEARLKSIPVVILTAKQLTADVAHKKAPHITEYLVKPVTKEGLISVIEDITSSSKKLGDFIDVARKAGVDPELIGRYVQLNQQTSAYKRLHTSLVQIYTKKRLEEEASIRNTMRSIERVIDLNGGNLEELHTKISEMIGASG